MTDGNASPAGVPCDIDELRTLFLFEKLDDDKLRWLCERGRVIVVEPGYVFREGDPAREFYVLLDGSVALYRTVGADEVETTRTDQRGVYAGAWTAYLETGPDAYLNSMRATARSRFYALAAEDFAHLMRAWFPMPVHLLDGLFWGTQNAQRTVGQRERLLALGSLSAGLTHELNNPAAAAVRATASLRERVAGMRHKLALIAGGPYERASLEALLRLQEDAVGHVAKAAALTPLEASDREEQLGDWLDARGVREGWDIASTFVQAGLDIDWLDRMCGSVPDGDVEAAVRWLNYTLETELLMDEIEDATTRISTLVGAAKQYSQLDRAPQQIVDIHELLDSTLLILGGKMGPGVKVVKDYDRSLPALPVYAAELNQVWTNLIDNAVGAMGGNGTIRVRTARDEDRLLVEIGDTGPGIPADIKARIFEPFFTTKAVGEGTGLGLDISWRIVVGRHHGDLSVESEPGDTRFQVRLPLVPPSGAA